MVDLSFQQKIGEQNSVQLESQHSIGSVGEKSLLEIGKQTVGEKYHEIIKAMSEFERRGGFGTSVTYETSDPRALETNPDGLFTTYSFEWELF